MENTSQDRACKYREMSFSITRGFAAAAFVIFALQTVLVLAQTIPDAALTNIIASPASLTYGTWQIGAPPPPALVVTITSVDPTKVVAVTGSPGDCAWLSLSGGSGDTPYVATVPVNTAGLAAGNYSCTLTFAVAGLIPIPVTASLTVIAPVSTGPLPSLACTPATGPVQVGVAYSASCTASGGVPPYHWSTGTLPAGLTLSATRGDTVTISGTPTVAGAYNYQVQLTDSGMPAQTATPQAYNGSIQPPLLTFTCTPATGPVQVGTAYSASCKASGGTAPYTWSTGTLPAGLTLSATTGATVTISGTPTTAVAYNYQVQLTDGGMPAQSATPQGYSGSIQPPSLTFTCTPATGPVQVGTAYSASCRATGGTPPYAWSTGTLPAGLTLGATTGTRVTISGTPTTAGDYNYQVQLTDSGTPGQNATPQTYNGSIQPPTLTFTCTPATGPVQVGTAYSASCKATGGTPPYAWSTGTLPAGLTLSATTGTTVTISGTPTTAGAYNYQVQLTDSGTQQQSATPQAYNGSIQPPTLTFTCTPAAGPVQVGTAYSASCKATGGTPPYTWSTGTLAAGLTLSATSGATVTISGTPTTAGAYNYQVQLTDSGTPGQSATPQTYSGSIQPPNLTFTCTPATGPVQVGTAYSASCKATGGTAPYTWSTGTLPGGLTLSATTGTTVTISGTPTTAGAYNYQVQLTDGGMPAQTPTPQTYSGSILAAPLTFTCTPSTGPVQVAAAYSSTCAVTGGTTPFTFSISSGALPPGLTLDSNSGAISGTPTTGGAYSYTIGVKDSSTPAQSATQDYNGKIRSSVTVDPSSLNFTYRIGDTAAPASQTLSVFSTPPGTGFSASASGGSWLAFTVPGNAVTPGTFPVSINTSSLSTAGTLTGTITITPAGGSPVNVPVNLTVLARAVPPQLSPSPLTESLALTQGSAATNGQITDLEHWRRINTIQRGIRSARLVERRPGGAPQHMSRRGSSDSQ